MGLYSPPSSLLRWYNLSRTPLGSHFLHTCVAIELQGCHWGVNMGRQGLSTILVPCLDYGAYDPQRRMPLGDFHFVFVLFNASLLELFRVFCH